MLSATFLDITPRHVGSLWQLIILAILTKSKNKYRQSNRFRRSCSVPCARKPFFCFLSQLVASMRPNCGAPPSMVTLIRKQNKRLPRRHCIVSLRNAIALFFVCQLLLAQTHWLLAEKPRVHRLEVGADKRGELHLPKYVFLHVYSRGDLDEHQPFRGQLKHCAF